MLGDSPVVHAAENEVPRARARWRSLLEALISCPSCGAELTIDPNPSCSCGYVGRAPDGIPDFVDERTLTERHLDEIAAQTTAVDEYYENERKLCCHWDRISAADIPAMLDPVGRIALDLGCGTGTAGNGLRKSGMKVVGADLSQPCLRAAMRRLDAVVRADASGLPFRDGAFDAIVSRGALHHLADPVAALAEAQRVLKKDGRAIFMDPREWFWLEPVKRILRREDHSFTDDHHAYRPDEYVHLIERFFRVERSYTVHPFGILVANGVDVLPMPDGLPYRALAKGLYRLDQALNRTVLRKVGHLLVVVARKE
jgi:ubiquinone/menaquinone biosynthesis C-methylase UbiE